jgi:hypothetical protein
MSEEPKPGSVTIQGSAPRPPAAPAPTVPIDEKIDGYLWLLLSNTGGAARQNALTAELARELHRTPADIVSDRKYANTIRQLDAASVVGQRIQEAAKLYEQAQDYARQAGVKRDEFRAAVRSGLPK